MLKPWNMNWTSCLVRTHPEGEQGLDHMRLGHRIEVINEGFFYPQARAIVGRNDPDRINSIVKGLRLKARTIATREMRGGTPCEMPIMTWEHLSNELLHERCCEMDDTTRRTTRELRQEIYETIWDLDMVLEGWDFIKGRQLRFYPSKPAHFKRYNISK